MSKRESNQSAGQGPQGHRPYKIPWRSSAVLAAIISGVFGIVAIIIEEDAPATPPIDQTGRPKEAPPAVGPGPPKEPPPVEVGVLINNGLALAREGDMDGAIEHYRQALGFNPDIVLHRFNLEPVLPSQGEMGEYFKQSNDTLQLDPDCVLVYNILSFVSEAKGDLDWAIEQYPERLQGDPHNARAHNIFGFALEAKGDLDGAIKQYETASHIAPENAVYHVNLASARAQSRELAPAAIAALARAVELDERYRMWARTAKSLDLIRDEPAFRELVYGE